MTSIAPQRISAIAEDCLSQTAELKQLLERLSDADLHLSDAGAIEQAATAARAAHNAIAGITSVVRHEVRRHGL